MSLHNEVALLKFLLNACGEVEAIDAIKAVDCDIFKSYAVRRCIASYKQCFLRGEWPTPEQVLCDLEPEVRAVVLASLEDCPNVVDPKISLDAIRRDHITDVQLDTLSRGFNDLKNGHTTIEDIIQSLKTTRPKSADWHERNFADVMLEVSTGRALDPSMAGRNLLTTGIKSFDEVLATPPGSYGFIVGLPGTGKTSFLFQAAVLSALAGTKVMAMSLETPSSVLEAKTAATYLAANKGSSFVGTILKRGGVYLGDTVKNNPALSNLDIAFHPAGFPFQDLEQEIQRASARGVELFLIDYFSLLEPPNLKKTRDEWSLFAEMSKATKRLCNKLNVAITYVAQPNGDVKYGERPDPTQLAQTKQITRDVDYGILLWRELAASQQYSEANGKHLRLLRASIFKNRLFNNEKFATGEPDVHIVGEFRRNWFYEVDTPVESVLLPTNSKRLR